jgi:hypothetical protein
MSEETLELNLNSKTNIEEDLSANLDKANTIMEIVKGALGFSSKPVSIKGTQDQVDSLKELLFVEKQLVESGGLSTEQIEEIKQLLEEKVSKFQEQTEIEWPLR